MRLPLPFPRKERFMNKEIIGYNIRLYRKQRGLTLRSLSSQIGISYQQLSRIENGGGTSSTTLERIADILDIPIENLFQDPKRTKRNISKSHRYLLPERIQEAMNQTFYREILKPVNDSILETILEDYQKQAYQLMTKNTFLEKYLSSKIKPKQNNISFSEEELFQFSKELLINFGLSIIHELTYQEDEYE